jgi:urease beta subunit
MIPGETFIEDGEVEINAGAEKRSVEVRNRGDRPIQVGSHAHFFEVNAALDFDRDRPTASGWTCRLARPCASSPARRARWS